MQPASVAHSSSSRSRARLEAYQAQRKAGGLDPACQLQLRSQLDHHAVGPEAQRKTLALCA